MAQFQTGSKNIVANVTANVWSDAARAAAIEARRAGSKDNTYADPNADAHLAQTEDEEHLNEVHALLKSGLVKDKGGWHRSDLKPVSDAMKAHKDKMAKQKQETRAKNAHEKFRVRRD